MGSGRVLPERAVAALREAFAGEVAVRLPGMQSAAAELLATHAVAAAQALRTHAHTLASSAAVLGESLASWHARRCEEIVSRWCAGDDVPDQVAHEAADEAETVALLLAPWLLRTA